MPSIYIASAIENWEQVNRLQQLFRDNGVDISFDWTVKRFTSHEFDENEARQHGQDELIGLLEADYLLVVLPGGRGTHFELGAFLANYRRFRMSADRQLEECKYPITILYGNDTATRPTTFHYLPGITRCATEEEAVEHVLCALRPSIKASGHTPVA